MLIALIVAYVIVGTVIGRVLFRMRLRDSARYYVSDKYESRGNLIETQDQSSAMTYGLWSIFLWPLVLAFFVVQAPTPQERMSRRTQELKDATQALEAIAKEYDLKVSVL